MRVDIKGLEHLYMLPCEGCCTNSKDSTGDDAANLTPFAVSLTPHSSTGSEGSVRLGSRQPDHHDGVAERGNGCCMPRHSTRQSTRRGGLEQ